MARDFDEVRGAILAQLPREYTHQKRKPLYIDDVRYGCLFEAGIESSISFVSLSTEMTKSSGAPRIIKGQLVVLESWAVEHREYFE